MREFQSVLKSFRLVLWAGVGFLVGGGILAGIFPDFRSGAILAGIGSALLIGYAILSQIYAHWLLVLGLGAVVVPVVWWVNYRRLRNVAWSSVRTHERLKVEDPAKAKAQSLEFQKLLKPSEIQTAKKLKG